MCQTTANRDASIPPTDERNVEFRMGGQARAVRKATERRNAGEHRVRLFRGQLPFCS